VENDNRKTISIFEPGFIAIYEEDDREWKVLNRFENKLCNAKGMAAVRTAAVRTAVADTIKQLGDVKVIVASEIPGDSVRDFSNRGF
jgi:Fe-only nitrogenase accessory protein AnfO